MKRVKKIIDITNWFIKEYKRLEADSRLPTNIELAKIMGIKTPSSINNILAGAQNIQPDQWDRFRNHFNIGAAAEPNSSKNEEVHTNDPTAMQILDRLSRAFQDQAEVLRVQAEGFRAQTEIMRNIESRMATEGSQVEIRLNLSGVREDVSTLLMRQHLMIEEFRDRFSELGNLKNSPFQGARKK